MPRSSRFGKSGAIALTIASIVLLSGIWSMWLSPTYDNRKYEEIQRTNSLLNPNSTVRYSFETTKGQEIKITVDASYVPASAKEAQDNFQQSIPASISATIYDSKRDVVFEQANVTYVDIAKPILIQDGGTYQIEVTNNQNRTFNSGIVIIDATRTETRSLEPTGQWLLLISLPIFVLGIWLFIPRREQNDNLVGKA
jgi:hypothetical protein